MREARALMARAAVVVALGVVACGDPDAGPLQQPDAMEATDSESFRVGGTVSVDGSLLWAGGGVVGVQDNWQSDRMLVAFGTDGVVTRRIELPLDEGDWISRPSVQTVGERTVALGRVCGSTATSENPRCNAPSIQFFDITEGDRGDTIPIDMGRMAMGVETLRVLGTDANSVVLAAESDERIEVGIFPTTTIDLGVVDLSTGTLRELPPSPLTATVSACLAGTTVHMLGLDLDGLTNTAFRVASLDLHSPTWGEPQRVPLGRPTDAGGLFELACSAEGAVVTAASPSAWVQQVVDRGVVVERPAADLPGLIKHIQPSDGGITLTVQGGDSERPSLTVWRLATSADGPEQIAEAQLASPGREQVVDIDGRLFDVSGLAVEPIFDDRVDIRESDEGCFEAGCSRQSRPPDCDSLCSDRLRRRSDKPKGGRGSGPSRACFADAYMTPAISGLWPNGYSSDHVIYGGWWQ